ncbi:hypothetical protein GE061_003530 [Apolygus lucorum]|uniref:CCHC-type domain-containing protein n=1 Tax=Apolygus lucorum TaxID=248454 RepID=A0A8S9X6E2_APOLU|nr:hypothetical protein GE061_003530 [Apolygus lucorum]
MSNETFDRNEPGCSHDGHQSQINRSKSPVFRVVTEAERNAIDLLKSELFENYKREADKLTEERRMFAEENRLRSDALLSAYRSALDQMASTIMSKINRGSETRVNVEPLPTDGSALIQTPSQTENNTNDGSKPKGRHLRVRLSNGDNILKPSGDFSLWKTHLRAQLKANDCLFVIDSKVNSTEDYTPIERQRLSDIVHAYLISNLDPHYQLIVNDLTNPMEILTMLQNACRPHTIHHEHAIRRDLDRMHFNAAQETAIQFIARFNDKVQQLRSCPGVTFDEKSEKYIFMMAVHEAYPELYNIESAAGHQDRPIKELKELVIANQNRNEEMTRRQGLTSALYAEKAYLKIPPKPMKTGSGFGSPNYDGLRTCYNCGSKDGHISKNCPQPPTENTKQIRNRQFRDKSKSFGGLKTKAGCSKYNAHNDLLKQTGTIRKRSKKIRNQGQKKGKKMIMSLPDFVKESSRRAKIGGARLVLESYVNDSDQECDLVWAIEEDKANESGSDTEIASIAKSRNRYDSESDNDYDENIGSAMLNFDGKKVEKSSISFIGRFRCDKSHCQ